MQTATKKANVLDSLRPDKVVVDPMLGVALVSVACVLAPARAAQAPESFLAEPGARVHYDLAGTYTERGDLRSAVAELDAAYAIERHPDLLFIRAQIRRQLGECKAAVNLYRDFIATTPSESATDQAVAGIAACETTLGARGSIEQPAPAPVTITVPEVPAAPAPVPTAPQEAPAVPAPSPARRPWDRDPTGVVVVREKVAPPAPAPEAPAPTTPRRLWHRDPAGGVLLAFGLAGLAATGGLAYEAVQARRRADGSKSHREYLGLDNWAVTLEATTAAVAVVAAGMLVGAIVRYRIVARKQRQLGAWLDHRSAGLALIVRF